MYQATANSLLKDNSPEILTIEYGYFPIVYLYRHSLELVLKANIILVASSNLNITIYSELIDYIKSYYSNELITHSIKELFKTYSDLDESLILSPFYDFTKNIIDLIAQFDDNSLKMRYFSSSKMKLANIPINILVKNADPTPNKRLDKYVRYYTKNFDLNISELKTYKIKDLNIFNFLTDISLVLQSLLQRNEHSLIRKLAIKKT